MQFCSTQTEDRLLLVAAGIGASLHNFLFAHGEWHMQATQIFFGHVAMFTLLCIGEIFQTKDVANGMSRAVSMTLAYLIALYGSMVTYRLFFHRLRIFPGPKMARTTKLWHAWRCRHMRNHLVLEDWHQKYGDFVRTGPSELTIFNADAFTILDGPGNHCLKGVWYDFLQPNSPLVAIRDKNFHDERRKLWLRGFSRKSLEDYEPRILRHVQLLEQYVTEQAEAGTAIDVRPLCYWFAFDVMGDFVFANSFGMLETHDWHYVVLMQKRAFELLGVFSPVLWLARIAFAVAPAFWRIGDWNSMISFCHERMDERINIDRPEPDVSSWLIDHSKKQGFTPFERRHLYGDAVQAIIAGSDPVGSVLLLTLYNLARYPQEADKIFSEVVDADIGSAKALQNLQHLAACIDETMRLYPTVPTSVPRLTPPEGIEIAGKFIPGGTTVIVPRYSIARLEKYYKKPHQFIPERWYSRSDLVLDKKAFNPFGIGKTNCVGRDMALMEIKFVIASLVRRYHVRYGPCEDGARVEADMIDHFTATPGSLRLKFESRG